MKYMNDYDLSCARRQYGQGRTPNRLALVMVVDSLREWTDNHSDGWAYWPKPCRAAAKAMELIDTREDTDITDGEMQAAVRPIKAFMTRESVDPRNRELILRSVV